MLLTNLSASTSSLPDLQHRAAQLRVHLSEEREQLCANFGRLRFTILQCEQQIAEADEVLAQVQADRQRRALANGCH